MTVASSNDQMWYSLHTHIKLLAELFHKHTTSIFYILIFSTNSLCTSSHLIFHTIYECFSLFFPPSVLFNVYHCHNFTHFVALNFPPPFTLNISSVPLLLHSYIHLYLFWWELTYFYISIDCFSVCTYEQ